MFQPLALDADEVQLPAVDTDSISEEAPSKRIKLTKALTYPKAVFEQIYEDRSEFPKELIHLTISYLAKEFKFVSKNGEEITVSATLLYSKKSKSHKYTGRGWKYRWLLEWQASKAIVQTRDLEAKDCEFVDLVPTVPEQGMEPVFRLDQEVCAFQWHRGPDDDAAPVLVPESATLQVEIDKGDMNLIGYMTPLSYPMKFNICKMKQTDNRFLDLAAKEFWGDAEIQHENLAIENSRDETFTGTFSARDQALGWIRGTHEKAIGGGDYYIETGTFNEKRLHGPDCMQYWQCGEVVERKAKYGTFEAGKLVGDFNTSMRFKPAPLADHVHCLTTFGKFTGKAESNGVKIKSVSETDSVMMAYAKGKSDHFEKHYLHIGTLDNESLLEGKECLAIHYPACGQRITELGMFSSGVYREGYFLLDGLLYHWDDNCRKLVESETAIAALKSRMDLAYRASFVGPQPARDRWHPDEDPETLEQHAVRGKAILEEFERQSAKCAEVLVW